MKIECKQNYYTYRIKNNRVVFYNELYNNSVLVLLFTAIIEAVLPERNSFNLPIAVEAEIGNNDIILNEKLRVSGTSKYSYFIPFEHYNKWKKTYAVIYCCLILLELLVSCVLLYIFVVPSHFNFFVGIIFAFLALMLGFLIYKFIRQLKIVKKMNIKSLNDI